MSNQLQHFASPSKVAEGVMLQTCISEVLGFNFGQNSSCSGQDFVMIFFYSFSQFK
jgi:hypothetical protein